ncbi:ribbon-helix-helix domain-containing protein [Fulvimarina sp. 2208YS6-2-32]|uniref:Ribbon-helix-helix domain-containing protein n=1 Tax=Fulvimarina uroteuthidis TaxID=3098149 RepID=A0ABU5I6W8_9HYPH|nr:ribbon-helix-helix domain-containing protein [Fulvimarina sp. 2208YS6-2-32]MDY8111137.1 ribbon-helix-helix domain-containing protein [Fulvimarina sp. 2208YS6-2-32]
MAKASLRDMQRRKPVPDLDRIESTEKAAEERQEARASNAKGDGRKGVLVRLSPESWHLLGVLAGELTLSTGERHTKQSLMVEALNDVLKKHGKPPIA